MPVNITLDRQNVRGAFNGRLQWKRGGMLWVITVDGVGNSDGQYAFNRKKDAVAAYDFATTEWNGEGCLVSMTHEWMIRTHHELADSFKGEF